MSISKFNLFPSNLSHPFYDGARFLDNPLAVKIPLNDRPKLNDLDIRKENKDIEHRAREIVFKILHMDLSESGDELTDYLEEAVIERANFACACNYVNRMMRIYSVATLEDMRKFLREHSLLLLVRKVPVIILQGIEEYGFITTARREVLHTDLDVVTTSISEKGAPSVEEFPAWLEDLAKKDPSLIPLSKQLNALTNLQWKIGSKEDPTGDRWIKNLKILKGIYERFYHLYPSPSKIRAEIKSWEREVLRMLKRKDDPIDIAAYVHIGFLSIRPFIKANGRTARILMNLFLRLGGYEYIQFPSREEYLQVVERSVSKGDPQIFAELMRKHLRPIKPYHTEKI